MSATKGTISLILGETLMSLYPIVVKTFQTNLFTQVIIRLIVFVAVSVTFMSGSIWELINSPTYLLISLLNLVHIYTSYWGFLNLDVGVSLAIFYLYPLINVLIKNVLIDHHFDWDVIKYFLISCLGVYLIAFQNPSPSPLIAWGVLAIIIATISESLIYTFYKADTSSINPFDMLFTLHFWGLIAMLLIYFGSRWWRSDRDQDLLVGNATLFWKLFLANLVIGVCGHWLRFYSLVKISTEWFSILAFLEVIIGFILGWGLLGETLSKWHFVGLGLIFFSVYQVAQRA